MSSASIPLKDAQYLSVGQVDLQRVRTRHVLKLTDHGRHIVTENIELQKVLVDFVVIEMGCDNIRRSRRLPDAVIGQNS